MYDGQRRFKEILWSMAAKGHQVLAGNRGGHGAFHCFLSRGISIAVERGTRQGIFVLFFSSGEQPGSYGYGQGVRVSSSGALQ